MKLKIKYAKQEDIPEGYAELYTEKAGEWHLTGVEGLKTDESVANLEKTLKKERDQRAAAEAKLKTLTDVIGDVEVEEFAGLKEKVEDLEEKLEAASKDAKGKPDEAAIQTRIDNASAKAVERANKASAKTIETLTKERDAAVVAKDKIAKGARAIAVRTELIKAANDAKVLAPAQDDVLNYAHLFDVIEVEDDDSPTGFRVDKIVTGDKRGAAPGLTISEWLADQKEKKSHWWGGSAGAGAGGGGGGKPGSANPFAKGSFNLTEAGKLMRDNPARAQALASTAGFASAQAAIDAGADAAAGGVGRAGR